MRRITSFGFLFIFLFVSMSLFFSSPSAAPVFSHYAQGKEFNLSKKTFSTSFFKRDMKITAIGDSLTEGLGDDSNSGGYIGIIEKQFSESPFVNTLTVNNLGIPGIRSDQLLKKIKTPTFQENLVHADVVFITIGGNDLIHIVQNHFLSLSIDVFEKEKETYANNLKEILFMIGEKNPKAKVYYIGLFNPFLRTLSELEEINEIIDSWNIKARVVTSGYKNVTYVPIDDIFESSEENLLFVDQFHPNESGYKLIAERVITYVQGSIPASTEIYQGKRNIY